LDQNEFKCIKNRSGYVVVGMNHPSQIDSHARLWSVPDSCGWVKERGGNKERENADETMSFKKRELGVLLEPGHTILIIDRQTQN
jgi:hypothetical protein